MDREQIFKKISAVGRAALTIGIENSHSGNIALKCRDELGAPALAITATGAQKGELTPEKICYPALDRTNSGYFKASTETDIHARILRIPGINASMHGHTKLAMVVSMDDAPHPKANPRPALMPVDPLGARYLGRVPVVWVKVQSGSAEMIGIIPKQLETSPVCMLEEHGAFARGKSLEEALFHLCVLEHSGRTIFFSEILGVDLMRARKQAEALTPELRKLLPDYSIERDSCREFADEPDTVETFLQTGFRIFESGYSPFHTGALSLRGAKTLLYLPKAAMPRDLAGPMLELPLESPPAGENFGSELDLHRRIYRATPFKALLHCYVAEAQAQALALSASAGEKFPRVIPIDAEGGFLYPAIPILPPFPSVEELCRALLDYRMAIVAFGGVWAAGEQSVGEALRHISSCKDICFYRIMAKLRGLDVSVLEPKRAKNW